MIHFYDTNALGRSHEDASCKLAEIAAQIARGLRRGPAGINTHRGPAARLLLAAAARLLPDRDRDPVEQGLHALHDLLAPSKVDMTPEDKAARAVVLRRIHRDLVPLLMMIEDELIDLDASGCPWNDWTEVRDWMGEFAADEPATAYEDDLDRFEYAELTA